MSHRGAARKTSPYRNGKALDMPCAITAEYGAVMVPPSAHTLAGFRAWATSDTFPERGRISFIGKELFIDMSPEELETHNKVKGEIGYTLIRVNKKLKLGEFYSDGTLLTNVPACLSTEPDGMFPTWATLECGRLRLIEREGAEGQYLEVEGAPDWVLEIVSKWSVRKDTVLLRDRYFRAGVGEFWLIDARGAAIDFQILVRGDTGFVPVPSKNGWQASPLFRRHFRLIRQRNRVGRWDYVLQVKSAR